MGSLPATAQAVAPVPLFNIPTTVTPPGVAPSGVIRLLRRWPRRRLHARARQAPTMASFDTVITTGATGGTPTGTLLWEAVLTGGRWAPEAHSARHASGNPGNPAGPDVHAPGIHVSGALAYDLAHHESAAHGRSSRWGPESWAGWLVWEGTTCTPPTDNSATNTGIGVLLETVAPPFARHPS